MPCLLRESLFPLVLNQFVRGKHGGGETPDPSREREDLEEIRLECDVCVCVCVGVCGWVGVGVGACACVCVCLCMRVCCVSLALCQFVRGKHGGGVTPDPSRKRQDLEETRVQRDVCACA